MRRFLGGLTALTVAASLALAVQATAAPRGAEAKCLKVSAGLLANLKDSLKGKARGKMGTPKGVKSGGTFSGPRDLQLGVYFVSARIAGYGIATWAVGREAFRTGGGIVIGIGPVARRASDAGTFLTNSQGSAPGIGLTPAADGWAESQACVK